MAFDFDVLDKKVLEVRAKMRHQKNVHAVIEFHPRPKWILMTSKTIRTTCLWRTAMSSMNIKLLKRSWLRSVPPGLCKILKVRRICQMGDLFQNNKTSWISFFSSRVKFQLRWQDSSPVGTSCRYGNPILQTVISVDQKKPRGKSESKFPLAANL